MSPQFSFLGSFVEAVLLQNGFDTLTEEQRLYYIPQVTALLEERIGLELLPKLKDTQLTRFAALAEDTKTSPEDWRDFWYESLPDFEGEIKRILVDFAEKTKTILAKENR